jgi:hypothetical protein
MLGVSGEMVAQGDGGRVIEKSPPRAVGGVDESWDQSRFSRAGYGAQPDDGPGGTGDVPPQAPKPVLEEGEGRAGTHLA